MRGLKLIGRGSFTKAYQKDADTVLLKSVDPIKECMSLGWFPSSRLFPKIERIDNELYEMKYYKQTLSLKASLCDKHYKIYQTLRALKINNSPNIHDGFEDALKAFRTIKDYKLRIIMIEALEACSNYGSDIGFEISPRNVAATKTGKLILLDCFFMKSKLLETRK